MAKDMGSGGESDYNLTVAELLGASADSNLRKPAEKQRPAKRTQREIQCLVCNKTFKKQYNLKIHQRCHTGETPLECRVEGCHLKFRWRSSLINHLKYHDPPSLWAGATPKPEKVVSRRILHKGSAYEHGTPPVPTSLAFIDEALELPSPYSFRTTLEGKPGSTSNDFPDSADSTISDHPVGGYSMPPDVPKPNLTVASSDSATGTLQDLLPTDLYMM